MNCREYKAAQIRRIIDKEELLPEIPEVVEVIMEQHHSLKREEIVGKVSQKTGIAVAKDLEGAVSEALKHMENQRKVSHVAHGFWQKN